uniref:Uncharacterized protein n=1 Tax=Tetranychus urticae TaxID=32264 RepID=T1K0C6_TETUR
MEPKPRKSDPQQFNVLQLVISLPG